MIQTTQYHDSVRLSKARRNASFALDGGRVRRQGRASLTGHPIGSDLQPRTYVSSDPNPDLTGASIGSVRSSSLSSSG